MTTFWQTHNDFKAGIFPDVPGYLIPEDGLYDAVNVLLDQPGKIRKRGCTVATGTQTQKIVDLILFQSGSAQLSDRLMGVRGTGASGDTPGFCIVNTGTGAMADVVTDGPSISAAPAADYVLGKAFMHLGFLFCPIQCRGDLDYNWMMVYGGASSSAASYEPTGSGSGTVVGGSPTITQPGVTFPVGCEGCMVVAGNGSGDLYVGHVIKRNSSTSIDVEPTPPTTFTPSTTGVRLYPTLIMDTQTSYKGYVSGSTAVSWQNRIVLSGLATAEGSGVYLPRRIAWTTTPDDTEITVDGNDIRIGGLTAAMRESVLANNFVEVASGEAIKTLRPVGIGTLAVFGLNSAYRVLGDLPTIDAATTNPATYDLWPLSNNVGSISDKACISTPHGLVFATSLGVYVYDGSKFESLMDGSTAQDFQNALQAGAPITGAALVRNHYILGMGADFPAYVCNLTNLNKPVWTRATNLDFFGSAGDPSDVSKVWAAIYWDTSAPGISQPGGQVVQLDSIFTPTIDNTIDADGITAFSCSIKTRAYFEGDPQLLKRFTRVAYEYVLDGTGVVTCSVDTILDPADAAYEEAGVLPPNVKLDVLGATNATPIEITVDVVSSHGYADGDRVNIRDVVGNTAANGVWVITATGTDTFTLNGSDGNSAYVSGGTANQSESKLFQVTSLLPKAFAIEHKIVLTDADFTPRFELLSIKHGFQAMRQGRQS